MRCRCFRPFLTIPIGAIIFGQSSGPIVFWCYFQLKDRCLAMIFVWKPKNRVFYNMLNFAPNCAYISALGVKKKHQNKEESMTWEAKSFFWDWLETFVTDEDTFKQAIFDWIVWHLLWAAIKADHAYHPTMVFLTLVQPLQCNALGSIMFWWFSDKE